MVVYRLAIPLGLGNALGLGVRGLDLPVTPLESGSGRLAGGVLQQSQLSWWSRHCCQAMLPLLCNFSSQLEPS